MTFFLLFVLSEYGAQRRPETDICNSHPVGRVGNAGVERYYMQHTVDGSGRSRANRFIEANDCAIQAPDHIAP